MFNSKDLDQIAERGMTPETVERQLGYFRTGFPFLEIDRAAVVGDGILKLEPEQAAEWSTMYDRAAAWLKIEKFVPASGAATRMFKDLYEYVGEGKSSEAVEAVLNGIEKFAFYDQLKGLGTPMKNPKQVIGAIIEGTPQATGSEKRGLGYGSQPKGLILFHRYKKESRTAMEEHLVEVALYGGSPAKIHFTVSPEHQAGFEKLAAEKVKGYAAMYGVDYEITYSVQDPATDTIAVNPDNAPFREGGLAADQSDGRLVFRPGGHGALIHNLDRIDADVIFIKTVDNVVPDHLKADTVLYKKALAAIALELQQQVFAYLRTIDGKTKSGEEDFRKEVQQFVEQELRYRFPKGAAPDLKELRKVLDRPLRVCGMVRNEGEPGGGPFWVRNQDGVTTLQIAESSQIDPTERERLMGGGTHFNPVDLVCAVRNFKGRKFDLERYVDPKTGFISVKSKDGRLLKAQELPGLWNGAMADWTTLFVEVPISTFAPVKTVVDLLRPQHQ